MNLIFDFDGTICDSLDTFIDLSNPILKFLGRRRITRKELREKGALKLLKEREIPRILIPFLLIYIRVKFSKLIPKLNSFPTLNKTLKKLSKNHTMGIVTSNSNINVNRFMAKNGLSDYFQFVYSSINYFDKSARIKVALTKYNLDPKDTYFVGDETRDVKAAKLSGIRTIAVTWGAESESLLKKAKPSKIIRKPTDLLSVFK